MESKNVPFYSSSLCVAEWGITNWLRSGNDSYAVFTRDTFT